MYVTNSNGLRTLYKEMYLEVTKKLNEKRMDVDKNPKVIEVNTKSEYILTSESYIPNLGGEALLFSAGRPIVVVNIRGLQIPFYCTSNQAGKNRASGRYPIMGFSDVVKNGKTISGWFNKISDTENYYKNIVSNELYSEFTSIAKSLSNLYGNDTKEILMKNKGKHMESADLIELNSLITIAKNSNALTSKDANSTIRSNVDYVNQVFNTTPRIVLQRMLH